MDNNTVSQPEELEQVWTPEDWEEWTESMVGTLDYDEDGFIR